MEDGVDPGVEGVSLLQPPLDFLVYLRRKEHLSEQLMEPMKGVDDGEVGKDRGV